MSLERDYLESAKRRLSPNSLYERLIQLDTKLIDAGFPELSDWWKRSFKDFYATNKRQLVLRVGRRGGKSSSLCRIAVAEALWGNHKIPAGDIGVVAIISVNKNQAAERIRTIEAILKAIKVPYRRAGDCIELQHRPVKLEVFAASVMASAGFTSICVIADECALWRNQEGSANPAEVILKFIRPTMATMPNARMFLSSSPFATLDAHHIAFEIGDSDQQIVRHAPTWVANPTLSEQDTHKLEPDHLEWLRQFAAVPMSAGSSAFFDAHAVDKAVDSSLFLPLKPTPGDAVSAGGDFAFRSDSSALAIAYRRGDIYIAAELLELRPEPNAPLKPSKVVETFAEVLKRHQCSFLVADNHYRQSIAEHLETYDLSFTIAPEGAKGNQEVFVRFRRLLHDGLIRLPKHDRLINQLKQVVSVPTAGGGLSIRQPRQQGGGHGDIVSALVLACFFAGGTQLEEVKPRYGTPEWRQWYNSPEQIQAREDQQIQREVEQLESDEDKPWWDA